MTALRVLKPSDVVNDVLLWLHNCGEVAPARMEAYVSSFGLSARRYSIVLPPSHGALLLQCITSQVLSRPSVHPPPAQLCMVLMHDSQSTCYARRATPIKQTSHRGSFPMQGETACVCNSHACVQQHGGDATALVCRGKGFKPGWC